MYQLTVKPSLEVLFEKYLFLLKDKRLGLITNPTGVNSSLVSSIALFKSHPDIQLAALFGPEHGVRANAQAGEYVTYYFDKDYQIPTFSLYGQSKKQDEHINLDESMRNFDILHSDKQINPEMLQTIDAMVFDLQDVGTRIYTYIATMAYAMQACAQAQIPFIVLDRPNPINGSTMGGPMLKYPQYSSFIGLYPIPLRHAMTVGELAQLFNEKFLNPKVDLSVVPMENWHRDQWFDETGLPWVSPSPNLPTQNTALVYPGQVLLEGTNLSEGRGTTLPFEFFGAPWLDGYALTKELNKLDLPGITFREIWFTPTFSKYAGTKCRGAQLHVRDRRVFNPISTTLAILLTIKHSYGELQFYPTYFDYVIGHSGVREAIERRDPLDEILSSFHADLKEFAQLRKPFLLY